MTWLAIDPALRSTGWAIMDEKEVYAVGLITTQKDDSLLVYLDNKRCMDIMTCGLRDAYCHGPHVLGRAISGIYAEAKQGGQSAKAAAAMAMAQGVMFGALGSYGDVTLILPGEAKLRATGSREASKDEMRAAAKKYYPNCYQLMLRTDPKYRYKKYNEHVLDAICVGWAINQRNKGG